MEDKSTMAEIQEALAIIVSRDAATPLDIFVRTSNKNDDGDGTVEGHSPSCSFCSLKRLSASDVKELINCLCQPRHVMKNDISCGKDEEMDNNGCLACDHCGFMTYSMTHLLKHSDGTHRAVAPKFVRKILSVSASARVRLADALFYCRLINQTLLERDLAGASTDREKVSSLQALSNWTSREDNLNMNHDSGRVKADPFGKVGSVGVGTESGATNSAHRASENTNFIVEIDVDGDFLPRHPSPAFQGVENEFKNSCPECPDNTIAKPIATTRKMETKDPTRSHVKENLPGAIVQQKKPMVTSERTMQKDISCPPSSLSASSLSLSPSSSASRCEGERMVEKGVRQVNEMPVTNNNSLLLNRQAIGCQGLYQNYDVVHSYKRGYSREKPLLCRDCFQPFYRWMDLHAHTRTHRQERLGKKMSSTSRVNCTKRPDSNVPAKRSGSALQSSQRQEGEESLQLKANSSHNSFESDDGRNAQTSCDYDGGNSTHLPAPPLDKERLNHVCKKCGLTFNDITSYCTHMRTHQQRLRPYKCKHCGKFFLAHTTFIQHMRRHRGEPMPMTSNRPVERRTCTRFRFKEDRKSIYSRQEKYFRCSLCDQRFEKRRNFENHVKRHQGEKPYECKECGKKFIWRNSLDNHMRLHTGKRLLWCHICGRKYPQRGGFIRHLRSHTGEKPYKCDYCQRQFNHNSSLKRHIRIHSGERPYQCDECGKTFIESTRFKTHMKLHKGIKSYQCEVCAKAFVDNSGLKKHLKIHKPGD